ncbi:hypothetical protein NRS6160_01180 [Bacillus subtilis]|uniref:DUF4145 domain-containing protein n=1 Tax=Bacillus subtilis TaxID=1423 RepID=A0A8I1WIG7_BACIU|nr:hypothetical protein [Bacillus subtilis]MBO3796731.1 hypothetical protein [Bacillus subtilis]CAF1857838.1 hypothetical protein NRS6160_04227 [Bacillus subtilis]CAI6221680.1 hypothetical protein NRS6160_01180 [Bacillus subtilis]
MSWLEFISSIIKSVAWPIIVLVAVLALRKPVSQLILKLAELKLKSVRYGEFEATFEDKLEDAESNVNPNGEDDNSLNNDTVSAKDTINDQSFASIAEEKPFLGVILSWQELEHQMIETMTEFGLYESSYSGAEMKRPPTMSQCIKDLNKRGYLSKRFIKTFSDLQQLRNIAVHSAPHDYSITFEESVRYRKLIKRLIKELQAMTPQTHDTYVHE